MAYRKRKKKTDNKTERNEFGRTQTAQAAMDIVLERFKTGNLGPLVQGTRALPPTLMARFDKAKGLSKRNTLVILAQLEERLAQQKGQFTALNHSWGGIILSKKQWEKVGRYQRKGSKAVYYFKPRFSKKEEVVTDPNTGEKKVEEVNVYNGTVMVYGYAYEQTDGKPVFFLSQPTPALPNLTLLAEALNITVQYTFLPSDRLGDATVKGDRIRIALGDDESTLSTFFHELAHALDAKLNGKLKGGQNLDDETVAEFTAAVLMAYYGYDTSNKAHSYIGYYAAMKKKDPVDAVLAVFGRIQKIIHFVDEFLTHHAFQEEN